MIFVLTENIGDVSTPKREAGVGRGGQRTCPAEIRMLFDYF